MGKRFLSLMLSAVLAAGSFGSGFTVYAQETAAAGEADVSGAETAEEIAVTDSADAEETVSDTEAADDSAESEAADAEYKYAASYEEDEDAAPEISYDLALEEEESEGTSDTDEAEVTPLDASAPAVIDLDSDALAEADSNAEETGSAAETAEVTPLAVSINAADVTIYGLDSWEEDLISIPDDFDQTFQLEVSGASSVSYKIISGDSVTVSSSGLIEPCYTTWYWYGSYGTTWKSDGYLYTTSDGDYGETKIRVTADSTSFTVTVNFVDYGEYYADQVMDEFIEENITDSMSNYEKVEAVTSYVATNYDYDSDYSSAQGMIVSGGGDCWASSYLIISMCTKLGMEAWIRNGNRDSGAGSGHRNALVADPDEDDLYYEAEAGYSGTKPRAYSVTTRTSLFSYRSTSGGIEVYQYDGNEEESGTLTVPEEIDGKTVVSIGENFIYGEDWDGVELPDTITNIDDYAFYYCTNLTSINLSAALESIGDYAFYYCTNLTSIDLPAALTSIGTSVFSGCSSLTAINVDSGNTVYSSIDGVLYGDAGATLLFYPCGRSDAAVIIPDGVITIGASAFTWNKTITSVTMPDTVTALGQNAFYGCTSLLTVDFSENLETIGMGAFYKCSVLEAAVLPDTLESIDEYGFTYCYNLADLDLGNGIALIENYVFYYCHALETVEFPASLTELGEWVFVTTSTTEREYTFLGDAPTFDGDTFYKVYAAVYYPCSNSTWTDEVIGEDYGAYSIAWYKSHSMEDPVISDSVVTGLCCDCGETVEQELTISLSTSSYTYNGVAKKPTPTVKADETALTKGTDYTVSYENNVNAGTGTVIITGCGCYSGCARATFTIKQKSISSSSSAAKVTLSTTTYIYSGKAKKPTPTVKITLNGETVTLKKGTDYTVSYKNNTAIGKGTVTITGTGNYSSTLTKTFKISPKQVTLSSAKSSAKKKLTVKWKKSSGSVKYQIAYRKKGSSTWKYKKVSSSTYSKTLTGLTSGKYYYVKVRAYKTVNGTTYCGKWSKTKKVKVK